MLSLDLLGDHHDGDNDVDDDKHDEIARAFGNLDYDGIGSSPVGPRNVQTIFSVIWQGINLFRFVTKWFNDEHDKHVDQIDIENLIDFNLNIDKPQIGHTTYVWNNV